VGQTIGLCRLLPRAFGPRNFMKNPWRSGGFPTVRSGFFDPVGIGVPPAKLHEKPAKANKLGTEGEQKAGFFAPVFRSAVTLLGGFDAVADCLGHQFHLNRVSVPISCAPSGRSSRISMEKF
jgi:hypothetical protein